MIELDVSHTEAEAAAELIAKALKSNVGSARRRERGARFLRELLWEMSGREKHTDPAKVKEAKDLLVAAMMQEEENHPIRRIGI